MKINPIKTFSYKNNVLKINGSTFKYSGKADNEVLESLISKKAYATTLLYLNSACNLKSINEKVVSKQELSSYLEECINLLESRSKLVENVDAKPLCNINKLELMEDNKNIYRGKAGKMYVELTESSKKTLKEDSYEEPFFAEIEDALFNAGFDVQRFSEAGILTQNLGWCVSNSEGEVQLQCNGTYLSESTKLNEEESPWMKYQTQAEQMFENAKAEMDEDMFSDFCNTVGTMARDYEFGYNEDDDDDDDLNEEAEGTQTTDVAEKKDQDLGTIKPKKTSKFIATESTFKVPYNHGFKGFTLTEDGKYTRGNYVLINEEGSIKAVRKANIIDDYGDYIWDYSQVQEEQAPRLVADMNKYFNKGTNIYDFGFRIENNQLKIYDANEEFDFSSMDDKLKSANKLLRNLFGKNAYFEAELSPIGVVAGIIIKDLN